MSSVLTIAKKEFRSFLNSPLAYIFLNIFLIVSSFLFFQGYFLVGDASMRSFFDLTPWMFLFLIPAITMRSWAEEKKLGTLEFLLTLPIRVELIVLGKFLASLTLISAALVLSLPIAAIVLYSGNAEIGVIAASYLGSFLMGALYAAIGIYVSSLTDNQITAFLLSIVVCFVLLLLGNMLVLQNLPSFLLPLFQFFGLGSHFQSIARGVIDSRDLLYYFSFTFLFLLMNIRHLEKKVL